MVAAALRGWGAIWRWLQKPGKGKQALEAKPFIGKALLYKPRDCETADVQDLRNHGFLSQTPCSGSKNSIHPAGVLTKGRSPQF